ncbi:hypothetical protein TNCV_3190911 [Trichonephila clavipes]|nr:hypothetical protein TNCV_3190911 [Trichonephila clavipes]
MADVKDLKSSLLSTQNLEATTQAKWRNRHSLRGARVTADAPCVSSWMKETMKFREEIHALMAQQQNQRRRNFMCRGSRVDKVSDRGWPCHEFEPSITKDRRVGEGCTLNLSRAQTSCRWRCVAVRRGRSDVVLVT